MNQTKTRTLYHKLKKARKYFYAQKAPIQQWPTEEHLKSSAEKELCITIDFNTRWTIDFLIDSWGHYCRETRLLVADNSNNPEASKESSRTCETKNIAYIKLPKNPVNHPSGSHGLDIGGKNWASVYKHLADSDIAETKYRTK